MALRAKLYLDGDIFFLILLRKIKKKMSPSKESFAAEGGRILFTHPRVHGHRSEVIKLPLLRAREIRTDLFRTGFNKSGD